MTEPQLPHISSDQLIRALKRCGFEAGPKNASSHNTYRKPEGPSGHPVRATIVLGKSDYPIGTLRAALVQAELSTSELLIALGGAHKRSEKQRLKKLRNAELSKEPERDRTPAAEDPSR